MPCHLDSGGFPERALRLEYSVAFHIDREAAGGLPVVLQLLELAEYSTEVEDELLLFLYFLLLYSFEFQEAEVVRDRLQHVIGLLDSNGMLKGGSNFLDVPLIARVVHREI